MYPGSTSELPRDAAIERLINLTFAFLNAERLNNSFLTLEWVTNNVPGYKFNEKNEERKPKALERLFGRDRQTLINAGVPIETVAVDDQVGFRIQQDEYKLKEVSFTPEEATVLALAGQMGYGEELSTFSRSGWTKIAASGINRDLTFTPQFTVLNYFNSLDSEALNTIVEAVKNNNRISFFYQRDKVSDWHERWMDPWGIVPIKDRLYLVGFDLDRQDVRCFRIARISDVTTLNMNDGGVAGWGPFTEPEPGANLQEIVENLLGRGHHTVDARIELVDEQSAAELVSRGEKQDDGTYLLPNVDRDWLVRTAVAFAPFAKVTSPPDVVEDIINLLTIARSSNSSDRTELGEK